MNRTTKFTQTKFKEKRPAPQPPSAHKHRKRCAPQPPDGETSEARSSAEYSPPPPPPMLKSFLKDIAQEVVTAKPIDMIDHLATYTKNLQIQLWERRQQEYEEDTIRMLMEGKAKQLEKEDHASRVIQMAFRGFKSQKAKEKEKSVLYKYVVEGVTLEEANKAAACIQRNFRKHSVMVKVRQRLSEDEAKECWDVGVAECTTRRDKKVNAQPKESDSLKELFGPSTPYRADGEEFGVETPCPMAAPLMAHQPRPSESDFSKFVVIEGADEDEFMFKMMKNESVTENISAPSIEAEAVGDSQEDADMLAHSSETKLNEEGTDMATLPPATELSSGSVAKVASGDNELTTNAPTATGEEASLNSSGELPGNEEGPENPTSDEPRDDNNEV